VDLKQYYSIRKGSNPCADGFGIEDLRDLFLRLYKQLEAEGYFTEAFGFYCVEKGMCGQSKSIVTIIPRTISLI